MSRDSSSSPQTISAQVQGLPTSAPEATNLKEISPAQWKSGIAAWLGWLFDGLDMHLYGLVAAPFVAYLLAQQGLIGSADDTAHQLVKDKSGLIQAVFLVGWALGGGFFGRLGDLLGRSRALSLTILCYAVFTGLSFFAQTWWQLLIFRFITALGIGGEWAVGSSLLSETWPKKWRPWIAAILQTGVNIGVLIACLVTFLMSSLNPKWVFLVGILPALLVFWIRRYVPEPEEWHAAKKSAKGKEPGILALFGPDIRRTTILTIIVCGCSLSAWWSFMFWHSQHLRNLPELNQALAAQYGKMIAARDSVTGSSAQDMTRWIASEKQKLASTAFFIIIGISSVGNFAAGWMAKRFGYRWSVAAMCLGFFISMQLTFISPRPYESLVWFWFPFVGFFSGMFGLFTMYLPPLFPVLLRTTGAGFCYNIGRILCAFGVLFSGSLTTGRNFSGTLYIISFLFLPALLVAMLLPDHSKAEGGTS